MHWIAWDRLSKPKKDGGLGFRDLHYFSVALLARQAWRILLNPESLCGQVLKAKYFPQEDFLHVTAKKGISYTWRSILKGRDLVRHGRIWRVGDVRRLTSGKILGF